MRAVHLFTRCTVHPVASAALVALIALIALIATTTLSGCTRKDGTSSAQTTPAGSATSSASASASTVGTSDTTANATAKPRTAPPNSVDELLRGDGAEALVVVSVDPGTKFDPKLRESLTSADRFTPSATIAEDRAKASSVSDLKNVLEWEPATRRCMVSELAPGSKTEKVVRVRFKLDNTARPTGVTVAGPALRDTTMKCLSDAIRAWWMPLPSGMVRVADEEPTTAHATKPLQYDFDVRFSAHP